MENIKHSPEFDLAYRFITETNLNLFLTGKAGTGKTTFLKYLRENSFKKMVVAAPTGVAAINAGGVTLHSLFQLPFVPFIPVFKLNGGYDDSDTTVNRNSLLSKTRLQGEKLNLLRSLELLVIDEASMVASHTVDAIDTILRSIRRNHKTPFGGVQVLFIGDMYQLQPVVKNEEWNFLKDYYNSIFFFDSVVLRENLPVTIELKEIHRQKDQQFVDVLNEVRNNCLSRENFELLNTRLMDPHFDDDEGYITLTTHNYQSDNINQRKLKQLDASSVRFKAEIKGDYPEHLYPADAELELKVGAQVMFLKNDTEEKKYFNGKLGVITRLTDSVVEVLCKDESIEIEVERHEWKNMSYKLDKTTGEIAEEELGSFTQYPLRLAWAITIHKSQGLTFDKLIIDSAKAFANGQVYVALSRCTSLEGLILRTPINRDFLGAHQSLSDWNSRHAGDNGLDHQFDHSRQQFIQQELQSIFKWNRWADELQALKSLLNDLKEDLPEQAFDWIRKLIATQEQLQITAEKFIEWMDNAGKANPNVEENGALQQRLKSAAVYFEKEITAWKKDFHQHPLTADKKKNAKKMDRSLEMLNIIVHEVLYKVSHCKNGFLLNEYLHSGKKFNGEIEPIQSAYASTQKVEAVSEEVVHQGLYTKIADMRRRISNENNLPPYLIFNNKTIQNVCSTLPGNKETLLKVKGFGKVTMEKYGDEVLSLVLDYCNENNIEPKFKLSSISPLKKKESVPGASIGTVTETVKLFKEGKTVEQIATERNLTTSTIEAHLGTAIAKRLISIEDLMSIEEAKPIATYFPEDLTTVRISEIKAKAPAEVSYGKLRWVLNWLLINNQ